MNEKGFISRLCGEEGQVYSYILKMVLVFVVIGIIISQCGPVIWNHVSLGNTASKIANEGSVIYRNSQGDMDKVREAVTKKVEDAGARIVGDIGLIYNDRGEPEALSVPIRKITNTLIFESWSYLAPYTEANAVGEALLYENM
jgi:hypothetical protein